jgi:hypothetical protein
MRVRLPAGRLIVEIREHGKPLATREATIEEGGETTIEIRLER